MFRKQISASRISEVISSAALVERMRLVLCPAQRGINSARWSIEAGSATVRINACWIGYGRGDSIATVISDTRRLSIARAIRPVSAVVRRVLPAAFDSSAALYASLAPDSAQARKAVPTITASAPRQIAAAMARPSAMPPAAIAG